MCELCEKAKGIPEYRNLLSRMHERDLARLAHSRNAAPSFSSVSMPAYSTIEYPKLLVYPMFEAKVAFAAPPSYFQNLFINGERQPGNFSHGATRSVFFAGRRLMLLSKSTATHESEEFFSSFLLAHFEPGEYSLEITPEKRIALAADVEKPARNLLTGKTEKIRISFSFAQENLSGKIMSKNTALSSTLFTNQFRRSGADALAWLNSTEYMFDYVVSVAHFSPHPYLLKFFDAFGYSSQKDFQEHTSAYFKLHLASRALE